MPAIDVEAFHAELLKHHRALITCFFLPSLRHFKYFNFFETFGVCTFFFLFGNSIKHLVCVIVFFKKKNFLRRPSSGFSKFRVSDKLFSIADSVSDFFLIMEPQVEETQLQFRSGIGGSNPEEMGFGFLQAYDVISTQTPSETGESSFTALLELPPPQAVELLVNEDFRAKIPPPIFPSNTALIDRASKFSVFATAGNSPEGNSVAGSCSMKPAVVKQEPMDSDSHLNSSMPPASNQSPKSLKRKEKEKKANETNKKSKKVAPNDISESSGDKLPYIHVRARRGQATDSHSLAERARREKINARMKLLQELVPGCNKISGTAMVLDEIINHVQALQRQVEFLSMRLAAVNPRSNINLDAFLAEESEPAVDNNYQSMFTASMCPEGQISGSRRQYQQLWHFEGLQQPIWGREEDNSNFITTENSLLSFDCPSNSASLHSSQLKMEL